MEEKDIVLANIMNENILNDINMNKVVKCVLDVAHNKAGFIEFFKLLQFKIPIK